MTRPPEARRISPKVAIPASINAGAHANGTTYSKLIHGLKLAGADVNRKMLADLAIRDPEVFGKIAEQAKAQLEAAAA